MAKCKRCGATLSKKAAFCTVCGAPTSGARPAVSTRQPSATKCANCGRLLRPGQKFCTGCGTSVTPTTPTPVTRTPGISEPCPHCGFANNPPDSYYCINCGQTLNNASASPPPDETTPEAPQLSETVTGLSCSACGRQAKPGSKFCIYCGGKLTATGQAPLETPESVPEPEKAPAVTVEPIPVPTDVLASLMARGRQLAIEEEYATNGGESDALLDELSQAAANSEFELEELIDTYINERAELERLEHLHEKSEVSDRVYERLKGEYDEKLSSFDERIQHGVHELQGYLAQILKDYAKVQEDLETIKARELIGDDEPADAKQKAKLEDKSKRYNYAISAAHYILKKESAMRNGPVSRFEITETTLAETKHKGSTVKPEKSKSVPDEPAETKEPEDSDKAATSDEPEAGKICNVCGRITTSDAKFCIHCGSPL